VRMFVAVFPPEGVVEDLDEFLAPRREASPFRWTVPEQFHLTLAFSGNVPERAYDDLVDRLERAARKRTPIEARIAGGGAFPNASRARVLFAHIETRIETGVETGVATGAEELRRAATGARAALAKAGAEVDGQRFRPHLTLARMGRPLEASNWVRLLDAYSGPSWTIGEIALVASHLGEGPRNRPRHEIVERFSLGRAGSDPARPGAPPRGR
jgi:RNA 2',3'-cyclic 3'-phosphodiesterase